MTDPSELKYSRTHEWVRVKGKRLIVGMSEYAQSQLSDIISIELPDPDENHYDAGDDLGVVESTRTTADFHAPVDGVITAINTKLLADPELINTDPYGAGWLIVIALSDLKEADALMSAAQYEAYLVTAGGH